MVRTEVPSARGLRREESREAAVGLIAVVIALSLAAVIFAFVVVPRTRRAAFDRFNLELAALADVRQTALENWLSDRKAHARIVAAFPSVRSLLEGGAEAGEPGQLRKILAGIALETSVESVLVISREGRLVASSDGAAVVDETSAQFARQSAAARVSMVSSQVVGGFPRIIVAAPAFQLDPADAAAGAVLFIIDPERWVYPFVGHRLTAQQSAEALLVRREGELIVYLSPLRYRADPPLSFTTPLRTPGLAALAALEGRELTARFVDYRGVSVLAATRRLANAPWGLIVKVDEQEVFGEAVARSGPIGAVLVLGALLAGLGASLIARARGRAIRAERQRDLERLALVLDATSDAVLFIARDGTILDANSSAEQMYGRSQGQLRGMNIAELGAEDAKGRTAADMESVAREGRLVFRTTHVHAGGASMPVEVSSRVVEIDGRAGFVSVVRDITDRIAAETRIDRLNRVLRTLAATNELIVRSSHGDELLQAVCDTVAREARLPLAWIGRAEPDGAIRVVAKAGNARACLDDAVAVRWDDTAGGPGPAGIALRDQRTVVGSASDDAQFAPWRDRALAAGLRSSIAAPISPDGNRGYVLCLCSGESDFFAEDVRELVVELAMDVALALDVFAKRDIQQETQELIRAIIESAPASIHVLDRQARVTLWNPESERLFGWSASEVLGARLPIIDEAHAPEFLDRLRQTMSGAPPPVGMVNRVRKDGTGIDLLMSVAPLRDGSGLVTGSLSIAFDVTEARENEQRVRALFETPGLPIATLEAVGDDLVHVDCNRSYARTFRRRVERVIGRSMSELDVSRERIAEAIECVRAVAASGNPMTYEVEVPEDDRRYVVSVSPLPGASASVARALVVMTDVTALRVAEAELRRLNTELEKRVAARTEDLVAANRELETFSYSVSHDLRAPLRAIDGFSRLVEEGYGAGLDDEGRRLLGVIRGATRSMARLIDDLLTFSRAGRQPIQRERVPMEAVARAAWLAIPAEQREGVRFELAAIPDAGGDASLIRQVWQNLLENAVKYSAPKSDRRVEVGSRRDGDRTIWFVRDNGIGFEMKYAATIFETFQRLHAPPEFEGTGVGLAIVQRIVNRHAGEVWAEGEPGVGATLYFTLGD